MNPYLTVGLSAFAAAAVFEAALIPGIVIGSASNKAAAARADSPTVKYGFMASSSGWLNANDGRKLVHPVLYPDCSFTAS